MSDTSPKKDYVFNVSATYKVTNIVVSEYVLIGYLSMLTPIFTVLLGMWLFTPTVTFGPEFKTVTSKIVKLSPVNPKKFK